MEDNENDDYIPINNDAPPVPLLSQINNINNININNNLNNNINNININESNFNLFPKNSVNKEQKKQPKQLNNNKNMATQVPFICVNPFLLTNPIYQPYNMMNLNYINAMKNRNIINNAYIPLNNNKNSINEKKMNNNSNFPDLILDIKPDLLKMLDKNDLIDIILLMQDNCKIKIDPKKTHLLHQVFKIEKRPGNKNEYLFSLKKNITKILLEKLNEQLDENINDEDDLYNINDINNINNLDNNNYIYNNNNIYNNNIYNNNIYNNNINNIYNNNIINNNINNFNKKNDFLNNLNSIGDNNFYNNNDYNNENINLINEHNYNNSDNNIININNNKQTNYHDNNNFYCEYHKKFYPITEYEEHFKTHEQSQKSRAEPINKEQLKSHKKIDLKNFKGYNINNSRDEKSEITRKNFYHDLNDNNYNDNMIKCSECGLDFNSVESMSVHYYEMHEKDNIENNINENENLFNNNEKKQVNKFGIKQKGKEERKEELKIGEEKSIHGEIEIKNQEENQELSEENETKEEEEKDQDLKKKFQFYCTICERGFKCAKALKDHNKAKGH